MYILSFNGTENPSITIHSRNVKRNSKGTQADIKRFGSDDDDRSVHIHSWGLV